MAARSDPSIVYSGHKEEQASIEFAFRLIDRCVRGALPIIVSKMRVDSEDGDNSADGEDNGSINKAMTYVFRQINFSVKQEGAKEMGEGLGYLQRRIWEVVMGNLLILENMEICQRVKTESVGVSQRGATAKKVALKSNTYLKQLMPKGPKQSEFKRRCMSSLAVFLAFGTSGLFTVWRDYRAVRLTSCFDLIQMVGLVHHVAGATGTPFQHPSNSRAFPRVDLLVYDLLRYSPHAGEDAEYTWTRAVNDWADLMKPEILAADFVADILQELQTPGMSMTPQGGRAPHVRKTDRANDCLAILAPTMDSLQTSSKQSKRDSSGGVGDDMGLEEQNSDGDSKGEKSSQPDDSDMDEGPRSGSPTGSNNGDLAGLHDDDDEGEDDEADE